MSALIANSADVFFHSVYPIYLDTVEGEEHLLRYVRMHKEQDNHQSAQKFPDELWKGLLSYAGHNRPKEEGK